MTAAAAFAMVGIAALFAASVGAQPCSGPITGTGQCGPANGNSSCERPNCCSQFGFCGTSTAHCNELSLCQAVTLPSPPPTSMPPNGTRPTHETWPAKPLPLVPDQRLSAFNWCGYRKMIALTFDDGPVTNGTTDVLLDDLAAAKIRATFFVSPGAEDPFNDAESCRIVGRMIKEGHSVQCHSWSHPNFVDLSTDQISSEFDMWVRWARRCRPVAVVLKRASSHFSLFRPPFGAMDVPRGNYINGLGLGLAGWNIDSKDFEEGATLDVVWAKVLADFRATGVSAIALHHDFAYVEGGTRGILQRYVSYFRDARGYKFVTAPQCFKACVADGICNDVRSNFPGVFEA